MSAYLQSHSVKKYPVQWNMKTYMTIPLLSHKVAICNVNGPSTVTGNGYSVYKLSQNPFTNSGSFASKSG